LRFVAPLHARGGVTLCFLLVDNRSMKPVGDLLPYIPAFVAVCEEKSFKKAALRLSVTTAAVSKAVQRLEEELGVKLLERTTRSVAVTRTGQLVQARFQGALVEIGAARAVVDRARTEPQGELLLHVSPVLTAPVLSAVTSLAARHPRLVPRVVFSDRLVRFFAGDDDVDVAVRLGGVDDDRLVARALATLRFVIVAAPGYLARRGTPRAPDDVKGHDVVAFAGPRGGVHAWKVGGVVVDVAPRVIVDSGAALPEAALGGLGLVHVFEFMVEAHLRAGRLVRLFPDVEPEQRALHAVTTPHKARTRAVRSTLEALQAAFASGGDPGASA
jgi:DNA-binding transcriptional LysR family regulator